MSKFTNLGKHCQSIYAPGGIKVQIMCQGNQVRLMGAKAHLYNVERAWKLHRRVTWAGL
ncbi:MAG: hypothetical protein QOH93_2663 [Chloroflexia bacterium]|nr:hypothetical protein [Chloroflexia bacterium]